ncbi:MAG: archaeal proteasome endopeptidase complex subunit alpha [DPANN group archaeon]|nr:archaeal proteasome endopeptidase complex subunit alpha [DPANN group archaeon]
MQPMTHQMMGYDRAITMFSPDGRLLQVEYAKKTVRQGSAAIGITCKDGIVMVTDKRIMDDLMVPEAVEKIAKIDDHLIATAAGILSDARVLIERAQMKGQQHRVTYDTPVDTITVVKDICNLKQICTQSGGLRPFGVSLLIGGIENDGEVKLFETDPTGIYFQYRATAIGEGEPEIEEILHKRYKEDMTIEDGIKLALKALLQVIDKNIDVKRIDCVYITKKDRKLVRLNKEELQKHLTQVKKK